jgi:hypothetical protein
MLIFPYIEETRLLILSVCFIPLPIPSKYVKVCYIVGLADRWFMQPPLPFEISLLELDLLKSGVEFIKLILIILYYQSNINNHFLAGWSPAALSASS